MASKDTDGGALPGSPWTSQGGPWDAIHEAVRGQLPTLDSDSSLSDCEDAEPFIFRRNQAALIPDLSEELAGDAAAPGGGAAQPVLGPVEFAAELGSKWKARAEHSALLEGKDPQGPLQSCAAIGSLLGIPEETPRWQEGDLGGIPCNTKESQSPLWGPQGVAAVPAWEGHLKTGTVRSPSPPGQGSDSVSLRALRRDRRKMIEKDILRKVTWGAPDQTACEAAPAGPRPEAPPEGPREGLPVLSLQQLEEWDLDHVLQSLTVPGAEQGDGAPAAAGWAAHLRRGPGHTTPGLQDELMERLALLCAAQSRASAPARKAPADGPQDAEELGAGSRRAATKRGPEPAADTGLQGPAEPPTIFLDLRQPQPPAGQCPENLTCSSSDSEEEEEEEEEGEQAALSTLRGPGERVHPPAQHLRDCTGKSQLLQQLRAFRKAAAGSELAVGQGARAQKGAAPGEMTGWGPGRKQPLELRAGGSSRAPALQDPRGPGPAGEAPGPVPGQP
ncbi:dynein axonemal assembly factor 8 isoform X1 [Dasypus novemcinctus]|uniref:dynein axonemal assembly factor 8 isoform X1 n=1 Tax=Dasypus novemcinctus TaxID=9361 RepID=UPI00265E1782|nr:dynein axonemal assembly factor 8 isoform X1 [Dasypus novemcinctus]